MPFYVYVYAVKYTKLTFGDLTDLEREEIMLIHAHMESKNIYLPSPTNDNDNVLDVLCTQVTS